MIIGLSVILAVLLMALSYIDIKTYRLPNALTFSLIGMGLIQSWLLTGSVLSSLIGAVVAYSVFVLIELGFKRATGKDGLGRGDAKLFAAAGAWLGWMQLPRVALIASLLGIVYIVTLQIIRKESVQKIPFGPFLAIAFMGVWIYGQAV